MNLEQFLTELGKLKNEHWVIDNEGRIRYIISEDEHYCPITAVCKSITGTSYNVAQFEDAAREFNLEIEPRDITCAADYPNADYNGKYEFDKSPKRVEIRKQMLEVLGLNK